MDKLFEYLVEQQAMAGGKLLEAINYALKRKERIYQIFEDGELPLDNNDLEQCIRNIPSSERTVSLRIQLRELKPTQCG